MKFPMILAVTLGLLAAQGAYADEANEAPTEHQHWVIFMTIIDRTTGEHLRQSKLGGRELEFNDLSECKKIVDQIALPETDQTTSALTCQEVKPGKVDDQEQDRNAVRQI